MSTERPKQSSASNMEIASKKNSGLIPEGYNSEGYDEDGDYYLDNATQQHRILCIGTDEELKALIAHAARQRGESISAEEIALARYSARQRERHHNISCEEWKKREEEDPVASQTEYALGVYREGLEYPVRDAVFCMRKKGYATYESGFLSEYIQGISIDLDKPVPDEFTQFKLSEEGLRICQEAGAEFFLDQRTIGFKISRPMSDEELKRVWDRIAEELPVLKDPQPITLLPNAALFRRKQDALRRQLK